jgi:hypothetical protein
VFGTLQNRLPQELRLARITTVAGANRYLKQRFVPHYNARFAVPAAEPGSAFVPYVGRPIEDILCIQEDRTVGADNCVAWNRRSLQIPPQRHRRLCPRDGAGARISRRPSRHLRRPALPRPLRSERARAQCPASGRLTPLGGPSLWICGQAKSLPTSSTGPAATAEADI